MQLNERIPNNVALSNNKRLLRALEHFPEARAAVTAALKASEPHEPQNGHYPRP